MAIKSSGALYLYNDIGRYFGVSASNVSLRNLSSRAGKGTPDAMSEFYGYGGGTPPPPPPIVAPPPPTTPPPTTPPPTTPPPVVAPPPPTTAPPPPPVVVPPPPTTPPPTTPPPTTPPPTTPPPTITVPPPVTRPPTTPPPVAPPPIAPPPTGGTCAPLPEIGYHSTSFASACESVYFAQLYANVGELCDSSLQARIYTNRRCSTYAVAGYWSQFGFQYRYWAGSSFSTGCSPCNF